MAVAKTATLLLIWLIPLAVSAQSAPRVRENFNAGWLFARQAVGSGTLGSFDRDSAAAAQIEPRFRQATELEYDDNAWQKIALPHTWNAFDVTDEAPGYWRGIGWYRKHFTIDRKFSGKQVSLEIEGANQVSEFWLNGSHLALHKGGYTSFHLDLTPYLRFGQSNVLTVKVDNLYHATVPPTVKTDYNFYGGIYRDVWLQITNPVYSSQVVWKTPSVSSQSATLLLHTVVQNKSSSSAQPMLVQQIIDPDNKLVASASRPISIAAGAVAEIDQTIPLHNPRLWSPDTPNVYSIVTVLQNGSQPIDSLKNPLGFRWFHFDPDRGFYLNGQRLQIQGVNWHQSYPGMGNALPNSRHWADMKLIRDMGANFWRTSHYPHDPATIDASDRLGLMVWEELPVNKEIGNPAQYVANVCEMAKEMIDRDRNHPSVITWGLAGEVNAPHDVARNVIAKVSQTYRELDPTRPVSMHEPRGADLEALVDVSGLSVGAQTDAEHRNYPQRCYMTAEYSAALIGRGLYGGGKLSEEHGCQQHEHELRQINRRPWLAGGCIWNAFDYDGESYDAVTPHVTAFGMTDVWRIPKEVYYFYQSQWSRQPMVHIVGHWSWPGQENHPRAVKVYSNAPRVELFLNEHSLGVKPDAPADDLLHPPRIWETDYQPGVLRAVAYFEKNELADQRQTAGAPYQILLRSTASQVVSGDPESLAYLTATIADREGTPVPDAAPPITFTSYGPGELLPQRWLGRETGLTWNAVSGMTRIAFRSTARSGNSVISAYSPGLKMGRLSILVTAPGKPDEMDYQERFNVDETTVTGKPQ